MTVMKIVEYPDPRLRQKSEAIATFDKGLEKLIVDMTDTMAFANGLGLAAVQVGVLKRLLLLDIGDLDEEETFVEGNAEDEERLAKKRSVSKVEVFINPEILEATGEITYDEGCLSFPGIHAEVKRHRFLKLRYQDAQGKTHEMETRGLKSIALQHEIDHLNGVVFTDHLGPMKRMMILNKYKKLQEEAAEEDEG